MISEWSLERALWREASRQTISVEAMVGLLIEKLPVDTAIVYNCDVDSDQISKVGFCSKIMATPVELSSLSTKERKALRDWLKKENIWLGQGENIVTEQRGLLPIVPAVLLKGMVLAIPLVGKSALKAVLLLHVRINIGDTSVLSRLEWLKEPFQTALENDRRWGEIKEHQDAVEAEKQSLLQRLGREEIVERIVGAEHGLKKTLERVSQVARVDLPVLILGETGSGKEVIARRIHEQSQHSKGPFIRVNCGAIPSELIDSELFGHEKGSFTGAMGIRRGWFERADMGTLFLDEVGELPLPAQVRLLRVLQDHTFERVGGEMPIQVKVRIVAATHRDLPTMVKHGQFREDLWYRLAVFPLYLPALRDHKQDLPDLVEHFALRAARRFGLSPQLPDQHDIELLEAYHWPGNIRELASVIDRAALLGEGNKLEIAKALGVAEPTSVKIEMPKSSVFETLDEAIIRHIGEALKITRGRVEGHHGAAKILGINSNTLRAKMRKLGMDRKEFQGTL